MLNISKEDQHIYDTLRYSLLHNKRNIAKNSNPKLREYQLQDVNFLEKLSRGKGVFNQQRLGKTPTTLETMRLKKQNNNLIIVPKSTLYQWRREYIKWHGGPIIELKDSWTKAKRTKAYKEQKGTLITNYEKVRIDYDDILENLAPFDAIVLDEAHYLRNYRGTSNNASTPVTVKAIVNMRKHAKDAYALTGTPTPNKEADICGILAFLFPNLFESYWNTVDYYFTKHEETNPINFKAYYEVGGFQNEYKKREMLEFLETFSVQRKRKDVMQWLPPVDYENILLEPTKKQERYYKELKEYYETDNIICENPLTTMIAMRQIANLPAILDLDEESPKFNWIQQHINDYPDKPMIIVSSFTAILKRLDYFLESCKTRFIHGKVSASMRHKYIEEFQNGEYNVLLANIHTVKEGVRLSRAEEIIFLDPSLTYTDNEQMSDRFLPTSIEEAVEKEGQKIIRLILKRSIDTYIHRALKTKQKKTDIINNYLYHITKRE